VALHMTTVRDGNRRAQMKAFDLAPGYASTIYKCQGLALKRVGIVFDSACGPGLGYVACSRVRIASHITFLGGPGTSPLPASI